MIRVTVWNEYADSCKGDRAKSVYPNGHHEVIKSFLSENEDMQVRCALLDEENQGLSDEILNSTDVLIWWGHCKHDAVSDELVDKISKRVYNGMGLILLHSAHMSKPFRRIIGASGKLCWSGIGERERLWVTAPNHPITEGIGEYIDLNEEEMYGEPFGIPSPDELIFNCWFKGGRVFRGGLVYYRGAGKVFYFQPGHEEFPTYYNTKIQRVITNAVRWSYNENMVEDKGCPQVAAIEPLD